MTKAKRFFTRMHEIEEKYSTDTVKYRAEIGDYHTCEAGWWFVEKNGVRIGDLHFRYSDYYTEDELNAVLERLESIISSDTNK